MYLCLVLPSVRTLVYPGGKLRPTQLLRNVRRRFKLINGVLIPGGGQVLSPGHPFYDASDHLLSLALDANDQGDYFPVSHFNSISTPGSCRVLARVALLIVIDPLCWIPACLVAFLVTQGVFDPEWKQNLQTKSTGCMQVHGTCLGFEALAVVVSDNATILGK